MRELARRKRARVVAVAALAVALATGAALGATLRDGGPGATAQTTATAETPATVLPANPPTCTAKALGVSRASNPGLAADCDTLLAIQSTLRVSGWINYDTPSWWDHSYALNWLAIAPLKHWRAVTLGGTPQRVIGLDFSDTRESVKVFNARTRQWEASQPFTREWTLRGVLPTQLGNLTALETLDLGGSELTGVVPTQLGKLERLRTLDLSNNKLTGELPETLDALTALTQVRVAGNAFTRCAPHGLWEAASHDLATLGLPNCRPTVSYGAPQTTGVVDAQGEYAFFTATGTAITTYEGLRNDVARLTIHERDTAGTSWAWFYDDVEAGDAFEWRKANDCWVRYVVDEVLADPSATLKALSVEWMTYAFTGCSGAVPASVTGSMDWGALPDLGGASLTVPIRHGPFQVLPAGWTGAIDSGETYALPDEAPPYPGPVVYTEDLSVARGFPYWRDPVLPAGWTFRYARSGGYEVSYGYCAIYVAADGYPAVDVCGEALWTSGTYPVKASWYARGGAGERRLGVHETRTIAGHPAVVVYSPQGQHHHRTGAVRVLVYNPTTQSIYKIAGVDPSLRGSNAEGVLAIARSMFGGTQ